MFSVSHISPCQPGEQGAGGLLIQADNACSAGHAAPFTLPARVLGWERQPCLAPAFPCVSYHEPPFLIHMFNCTLPQIFSRSQCSTSREEVIHCGVQRAARTSPPGPARLTQPPRPAASGSPCCSRRLSRTEMLNFTLHPVSGPGVQDPPGPGRGWVP